MAKKGADKVQQAAIGHNSDTLKKYVDRIVNLKQEQQEFNSEKNMEILALYNEANEDGFDRKELKAVVKEKLKPTQVDYRQAINQMLISMGDKPLYALAIGTAESLDAA